MPKLKKKLKKSLATIDEAAANIDDAIAENPEAAERILRALGSTTNDVAVPGDFTPAQMAKVVSEASQLADHYRTVAVRLQDAIHRALYFLKGEEFTEGDKLMAQNALLAIFGYEEPKEWQPHWYYNHNRPSHPAVLDTINASLFAAAQKGQIAESAILPDLFYRYVYEAVCWTDGRQPEPVSPDSFKYMGVEYRPLSKAQALLAQAGGN